MTFVALTCHPRTHLSVGFYASELALGVHIGKGMEDTQMHTIILSRTEQGWVARHSDPEIRRLFGTETLPTPFTATASPEMVHHEIQSLNPGARIVVHA